MRAVLVLAAVAMDLAAFGMAFTDIALRARSYHASPTLVGIILSSYFVFQVATSPAWGRLSDRIGRRPVAVACTALSSLSMVVYALMPSLTGIIVSRVLAGFAAANVSVIQASLIDQSTDDQRAATLGRFSAALNAGLIMGFAGGGWVAEHLGSQVLGWVGAGLSGLATLNLIIALPKTPPKPKEEGPHEPRKTWIILQQFPSLKVLFILASVSWFSLACLEGTFAQLINFRFSLGQAAFGWILMYEILLGFLLQGLFFGRLAKRYGHVKLLRVGYLLQGIGLGTTPFAPDLGLLLVASSLYALGKGLTDPSLNTLASESTPSDRQGEMFGLLQSARNVGFLAGPTIGGALFHWIHAAPYVLAGFVSFAAAAGAKLIRSPKPVGKGQLTENAS